MIKVEDKKLELRNNELFQSELAREVFQFVSASVVALAFYVSSEMYWVTALGIGVVVYSIVWYIESLGRGAAILQIMLLIAAFQWVLGPIIAYHLEGETLKYRMYVSEKLYMDFAVPAVIALLLGLRFISTRVNLAVIATYIKNTGLESRYAYILIFIGLFIDILVPYFPRSLLFVAYILAQFKFVGLLYLIVAEHRFRWLFTIFIFLLSLISSAEHGLFHGLILWSALIFSYICIAIRLSRFGKLIVLTTSMALLIALQVVKADYRAMISSGIPENESKVSLLIDMLLGSFDYIQSDSSNVDIASLNARLNQGWIISAVMNTVPQNVEFVEGETILLAFQDSLIPRFIIDKRNVRVSDNFEKFTGLNINKKTSMGISVLGEAYVNFGSFGGIVFMFFWGILIAIIMKVIVDISKTHPTIILWVPLIFLQMVKAETEIVVVMNHGVKTIIVITIFYLETKKILGWRI